MTNQQIASTLDQFADLLEFTGTNPFKLRAYRNASRVISDMTESIATLVEQNADLTRFEGIGKSVAEKCKQMVTTGRLRQLDELLKTVPRSVLDMLRIPKLGPKKAAVLFNELGIATLQQLQDACEGGQVRALEGFGAKTEQAILDGIQSVAETEQRKYWSQADEIVQQLKDHFSACQAVKQIEFAGSYRRGKETVGDLDILITSAEADAVMDHFHEFPQVSSQIGRGPTKMSVRLNDGFQIDLRVVPDASFGAALQYFTGSKDHNVILRSMAKSRGLKINEWGLFRVDDGDQQRIAGKTEKEIYDALGLPTFDPELREARQEFQWAESDELPELVKLSDLKGDLHMHTTDSDGKASIQEMIQAAKKRGLKYIAITDHSKRVAIANGLDDQRLLQQWEEIDGINKSLKGFTVLKGVECDILEDGSLDISDDVLSQADWVTASIHFGQDQSRTRITARIVGALEHPSVSSISHPTGRLLNQRKAYDVDMESVMKAAAEHGKLLELNAHPARLDLNDVYCAAAKNLNIPIVINSDAHSPKALDVLRFGIIQARRGGLTADDVANTRTWLQLKKLIGRKQ